jgi:predicted RNase H-like HicB family nuclease
MREGVVYRGEDGCWVAECPSLPGCVSQGTTREKAIANIKEAIEGYVLALSEDGLPVPEDFPRPTGSVIHRLFCILLCRQQTCNHGSGLTSLVQRKPLPRGLAETVIHRVFWILL